MYLLDGNKIHNEFINNNILNSKVIGAPRIRYLPIKYNEDLSQKDTLMIILDLPIGKK